MIEFQNPDALDETKLPTQAQFEQWVEAALQDRTEGDCVIRVVSEAESQQLNHEYRGKDYPTNVLSFPYEMPDLPAGVVLEEDEHYLGDLVICAAVVEREADEQNKSSFNHWAHMVIHGALHLQGYDHIEDSEAEVMEALEIQLLGQLNIPNPYCVIEKET